MSGFVKFLNSGKLWEASDKDGGASGGRPGEFRDTGRNPGGPGKQRPRAARPPEVGQQNYGNPDS